MSGRTFKHQPRASKEGWTNAHEHLIHLYVAFGLKSEGTALLKHTKLISNKCAFPDTLAYYARDRKQGYLRKKARGTLTEPEFNAPLIYQAFQCNDIITSLGRRANGIEDIPSGQRAYVTTKTPTNQTMPKPSNRKLLKSQGADDDLSVDASFSNTKDLDVDDMSDKMQQVTMTATPPRNPNRVGRGSTKQALAVVDYVQQCLTLDKHPNLYVVHDQCHSNPLGIEVFRIMPRCDDDGTERHSSIHLRLQMASVADYGGYDLKLNYNLDRTISRRTNDSKGSCVLTLTYPAVSYASANKHRLYSAAIQIKQNDANDGNPNHESTLQARLASVEDALVASAGKDFPLKPAMLSVDFVISPDALMKGEPFRIHNGAWQGDSYKVKPTDKYQLKKDFVGVGFDEESACKTITAKGKHYFVFWEFPIVGQGAAKFSSPAPALRKKKDETDLDKEAAELLAGL